MPWYRALLPLRRRPCPTDDVRRWCWCSADADESAALRARAEGTDESVCDKPMVALEPLRSLVAPAPAKELVVGTLLAKSPSALTTRDSAVPNSWLWEERLGESRWRAEARSRDPEVARERFMASSAVIDGDDVACDHRRARRAPLL